MKPPGKNRRIKNLTGSRGSQRLVLRGLRLTEGTTVHSVLEETGFDKKFLFLRFVRNDRPHHDILFEDDVDLACLPLRTVSLRTLAEALKNPMHGFSLQNLGALVFGAAIDRCAKFEIALRTSADTDEEVVHLSAKIKKFTTAAACTLAELDGFIQRYDDSDKERDGEEE